MLRGRRAKPAAHWSRKSSVKTSSRGLPQATSSRYRSPLVQASLSIVVNKVRDTIRPFLVRCKEATIAGTWNGGGHHTPHVLRARPTSGRGTKIVNGRRANAWSVRLVAPPLVLRQSLLNRISAHHRHGSPSIHRMTEQISWR